MKRSSSAPMISEIAEAGSRSHPGNQSRVYGLSSSLTIDTGLGSTTRPLVRTKVARFIESSSSLCCTYTLVVQFLRLLNGPAPRPCQHSLNVHVQPLIPAVRNWCNFHVMDNFTHLSTVLRPGIFFGHIQIPSRKLNFVSCTQAVQHLSVYQLIYLWEFTSLIVFLEHVLSVKAFM